MWIDRICVVCGKPFSYFNRGGRLRNTCDSPGAKGGCYEIRRKATLKAYATANREKIRELKKEWRRRNKINNISEKRKGWNENPVEYNEEKRQCTICGTSLSGYNKSDHCFSCRQARL